MRTCDAEPIRVLDNYVSRSRYCGMKHRKDAVDRPR